MRIIENRQETSVRFISLQIGAVFYQPIGMNWGIKIPPCIREDNTMTTFNAVSLEDGLPLSVPPEVEVQPLPDATLYTKGEE